MAEVGLRFVHQLSTLGSGRACKPLDVLIALHRDVVEKFHAHEPVLQRLASQQPPNPRPRTGAARFAIQPAEVLRQLFVEVEGRYAAANETVIEVLQEGALSGRACLPFLVRRASLQTQLKQQIDRWSGVPATRRMVQASLSLDSLAAGAVEEASLLCDATFNSAPAVAVHNEVPGAEGGRVSWGHVVEEGSQGRRGAGAFAGPSQGACGSSCL